MFRVLGRFELNARTLYASASHDLKVLPCGYCGIVKAPGPDMSFATVLVFQILNSQRLDSVDDCFNVCLRLCLVLR